MNTPDPNTTDALLDILRERFYPHQPNLFHRDRKRLLHAITWPAQWLEQRGLATSPQRYQQLIIQRLDDIKEKGDPEHYQKYFPGYLLKSIIC